MILDRIQKIKNNIAIYTNKKTMNLLDGTYHSIYKGKSLNFEDLREYVPGDNVKDIDWKASARSSSLLVKQFIAEKKHNIVLVFDANHRMCADTKTGTVKTEIALQSLGTVACLASQNGDYVSAIYNKEDSIAFYPFKTGLYHIERILDHYARDAEELDNSGEINTALTYLLKYSNRKSIVFIATDIHGIVEINEKLLKNLAINNNLLFIQIGDAELSGSHVYDVGTEKFLPKMILNNKKLLALDKEIREKMATDATNKLKRYSIPVVEIDNEKDVVPKILELLEKHSVSKIKRG